MKDNQYELYLNLCGLTLHVLPYLTCVALPLHVMHYLACVVLPCICDLVSGSFTSLETLPLKAT